MANRVNGVKPNYRPVRVSELKPVAEVYLGMLGGAGVLGLFTAVDPSVDAGWVVDFEGAVEAVGRIVPSRTIRLLNKDITRNIKVETSRCVEYGKVLKYFLRKAFVGQPGLVESFRVQGVNRMKRRGDTEGFLFELNTLVQQLRVAEHRAALEAVGWPVGNLANYEGLMARVDALNIEQELAKKLVPENTDAAIGVRNDCFGFIRTLMQLKDLVFEEPLKRSEWMLMSNLRQIRGGGIGKSGKQ